MTEFVPIWYDASIDYSDTCYDDARSFGQSAAMAAGWSWIMAETTLKELWSDPGRKKNWEDVRGAVFHGWVHARKRT